MNKRNFLIIDKLAKSTTLVSSLFVVIILLSSSSISVTLNKISESQNLSFKGNQEEQTILKPSTGLAPRNNKVKPVFKTAVDNKNLLELKETSSKESLNARLMYGYNVNCPSIAEGPVSFDVNDPGTITLLQETQSSDFLTGGTWNADAKWICCEYGSGVLWEVDPDDGTMTSIGGGGVSLNGLAWDPINNRMFGASDSGLYEVDYETGASELIGNFGNGPINMIGIACDYDGIMYGWDIGTDNLWDISLDTGQAYLVGPLGIDINYAQDGCFDLYYNTLYLTAYTTKGQLYEYDKETGECILIGDFQDGAQITASIILSSWPPDHDIGIKSINYPQNGYALSEVPMQVTVKNYGFNTEISDVVITVNNCYEEYNKTIENVEVNPGDEIIVDFPSWTPNYWQDPDYENTWQEYQVKACTLLDDDYHNNDCKQKIVELYFPWMHDVEITSIDSPCEDGPGKTYPVKATIKNVGQYPECCIPINISIGESVVLDTLLTEESWDTVPPSGWTDEHKNYSSDYGWNKSYTSYSGGTYGEAYLPYYYALPNYRFYTYKIDTTDYPGIQIKFKTYINHYSGQGLYSLEAGYSLDGINWYASWQEEPGSSGRYKVSFLLEGGYATTYIGFWIKGDPWYINSWYLDDVEVVAVDLIAEYTDYMCQGPDLEPGESRTFEFDDWTPEALLNEISCTKDYQIKAEIDFEGDNNPGNDIANREFALEYWHDVGIDYWHDAAVEVESSTLLAEPETWLHFDDGTTVNSIGLTNGGTFEYAIRLTPDELADYDGNAITSVKRHHGFTTDFSMNGIVKIYGQGTSTSPGDLISEQPFSCYEADWHEIILDEPVPISGDEDIWISIECTHAAGQYPAGCDGELDYPTKGDWIYLDSWEEMSIYGFSIDWNIWAGIYYCPPYKPYVYIKPGIKAIETAVTNYGTFPELDLTCYAEIYEYITNCTNGTLVYEDNITDIDLNTPLGGTELLSFNQYNFAEEGPYDLILNIPDENDDYTRNNEFDLGVLADDTPPYSTHSIEPATPDGDNGWYISDVEVEIEASDPEISCGYYGSGVKQIKYKIDDGVTQTINGDEGTFVIDKDKKDLLIEYWAIDYVGNEETPHNKFTIDMDQKGPEIDLIYEVVDGNYIEGWDFVFTATATDETSGMNRVRFILNGVEQDVVIGPGPTYKWGFTYHGSLNIVIDAIGYDMAGNFAFDEIDNPRIKDNSQQQVKSLSRTHVISKSLIKILYNLEC